MVEKEVHIVPLLKLLRSILTRSKYQSSGFSGNFVERYLLYPHSFPIDRISVVPTINFYYQLFPMLFRVRYFDNEIGMFPSAQVASQNLNTYFSSSRIASIIFIFKLLSFNNNVAYSFSENHPKLTRRWSLKNRHSHQKSNQLFRQHHKLLFVCTSNV